MRTNHIPGVGRRAPGAGGAGRVVGIHRATGAGAGRPGRRPSTLAVAMALLLAAVLPGRVLAGKRQPPPAVVPAQEFQAAQKAYAARNYDGAINAAKAALTKNERYTPAMLVMAKAYFKLHKYEWTRELGKMIEAPENNGSAAERADIYVMQAFMEIESKNPPGAIEMFKKASDLAPGNAVVWNNLGSQYLAAKNYKAAEPVLEKAVSLQPDFAKGHLNLGSAYRGLRQYDKAKAEYDRALQLFPSYADAVFNLGILYLDADKMPDMDITAKMNTAIGYLQRYKQMMGGSLAAGDPADTYLAEAQGNIVKEQKRIERQKKTEERERQRAAKKAADDAKKAAGGAPAAGAAPAGGGARPAPAQPAAAPSGARPAPAQPAPAQPAPAPGAAARPAPAQPAPAASPASVPYRAAPAPAPAPPPAGGQVVPYRAPPSPAPAPPPPAGNVVKYPGAQP